MIPKRRLWHDRIVEEVAARVNHEIVKSPTAAVVYDTVMCAMDSDFADEAKRQIDEARLPPEIARLHEQACTAGAEMYEDPTTGLWVMTAVGLRKRGYCCGNGCRHCPYSTDSRN
jgi:hypothetical protein